MTSASEEFISQFIAEQNPNIDLTENSPFYDLFVRFPSVTYLGQILALRDRTVEARSLGNTAVTVDEYDQLLANWFFERASASNTYITLRFLFSSKTQFNLNSSSIFTVNGINYIPLYSQFITESMFLQLEDQTPERYIIDIELISQDTGTETVVAEGSEIKTSINLGVSFISASVLAVSQVAINTETNLEALARLQEELGTRTTVNVRGIASYLSSLFPGVIADSYVAGFSEPEQLRDRIVVEIPKRVVRLFFKQAINLSLASSTLFFYDESPDIQYKLKNTLTVPATNALWKSKGIYKYVDAEIELVSLYNPSGFKEDRNILCPALTNNTDFVLATSRTTVDSQATVRIGGRTDVFLKTPVERKLVEFYVAPDSGGFLAVPETLKPLIKLHAVSRRDGLLVNTLDIYTMTAGTPGLRYSPFDDSEIFVDPGAVGTTVIVDASFSPFVRLIHQSLQDPLERIVSEDVLCKFMNPIYVYIDILLEADESLRDSIAASITSYVNTIPTGGDLIKSNMVAKLKSDVPSIITMYSDTIIVVATQYMPDGTEISLNDGNIVQPVEDLSKGVSRRNTIFILESVTVSFKAPEIVQ